MEKIFSVTNTIVFAAEKIFSVANTIVPVAEKIYSATESMVSVMKRRLSPSSTNRFIGWKSETGSLFLLGVPTRSHQASKRQGADRNKIFESAIGWITL
jgi:hypothetical protein